MLHASRRFFCGFLQAVLFVALVRQPLLPKSVGKFLLFPLSSVRLLASIFVSPTLDVFFARQRA